MTSKVGPCYDTLSMMMCEAHVTVQTYIIGDRGNILEAGEEADFVRTGIFIRDTELILELHELCGSTGALTMGTCTRPGQLNALLDKI